MSDNWDSSFSLQKEPIIIKAETIEIVTVTRFGSLEAKKSEESFLKFRGRDYCALSRSLFLHVMAVGGS